MSPVWPCYWSSQEMWSACFSKRSERRWGFNEQCVGSYWFNKYVCSLITSLICECYRKTDLELKNYLEHPGELPTTASACYTRVCCCSSGSSLQSSHRPVCITTQLKFFIIYLLCEWRHSPCPCGRTKSLFRTLLLKGTLGKWLQTIDTHKVASGSSFRINKVASDLLERKSTR